jgi:2-polyprenyl-6-methoxyphenol hydroxylase-like FAD-dependent oxidoreductase
MGAGIPNSGGILRPGAAPDFVRGDASIGRGVRLGVSAATVEQTGDAVSVGFSDGASATYDLIVGADGIHSRLRAMLFPGAPKAGVHRAGLLARGGAAAGRTSTARMSMSAAGEGRHHAGVAGTRCICSCCSTCRTIPRMPEQRWPRLLAEQLARLRRHARRYPRAARSPARINYRPLEKLLLPPPWHRGRAILIGDAAHATTPHLASGAGWRSRMRWCWPSCCVRMRAEDVLQRLHGAAL